MRLTNSGVRLGAELCAHIQDHVRAIQTLGQPGRGLTKVRQGQNRPEDIGSMCSDGGAAEFSSLYDRALANKESARSYP
jgi:hypothetical protein